MADIALVALAGAYQSSVGALSDTFVLARERIEQVFAAPAPGPGAMRMETRLRILSLDGASVAMADGRQLSVDGALDTGADYDFIWLPAFRAIGQVELEERIARTGALQAWLRHQSERGAVIGASGTSAVLLMAGALTGELAVPVSRALQPLVRKMFPRQRFEERLALVEYNGLLIAEGLAGDFALIVRAMERTLSPEVARWLAAIIGLEGTEATLILGDPLAARAQLWLERRFTTSIVVGHLATALSTSQATLNRRFHKATGLSPAAYVRQLRFDAACRMLERSDRTVDRIAQLVGYSDSRLFRSMFRRRTGLTATQWRAAARLSLATK